MQRLVKLLFSEASLAPTLERIEPREWSPSRCQPHLLLLDPLDSRRAVLVEGQPTFCFFRCHDESLFWQALRLLRIGVDDEGVYHHEYAGGKVVPEAEVKRVARLVSRRH